MDRFAKVRRILFAILILNWLVAFSKMFYGFFTKSAAMTADGFHSFGDGASNIIGLIGIWVASKPKDDMHPYGHKKFEIVATLGIAVLLFIASINIFREAIYRVFHPVIPQVTIMSFAVMLVTMGVNFLVMKYEHKEGERLSSDILICDAAHTRSDIFASIAVIGTLISVKMGFEFLDIIVAGIIAFFIAKAGFDILKTSSNILCDGNVLPKSSIASIVCNFSEVKSVHNIRTRGMKDDVHVDLHIVIDGNIQVDAAHDLSHNIEKKLKEKIKGISEVIVHVEPYK